MESKSFYLSTYAWVEASVDYGRGERWMSFAKQNYTKGLTKANLSNEAWLELRRRLKEIERVAGKMYAGIVAQEEKLAAVAQNTVADSDVVTPKPWKPWELTYYLSDKFLVKLNMFRAPDETDHITLNIRMFHKNEKGNIYFDRQQGVSLTYGEIQSLRQVMDEVDDFVSQQYEDEIVDDESGLKKRKRSEEEEVSAVFKLMKSEDLDQVTSFIGEFVRGQPDKLTCTIHLDKTQLMALQSSNMENTDAVASIQNDSDEIQYSQSIE